MENKARQQQLPPIESQTSVQSNKQKPQPLSEQPLALSSRIPLISLPPSRLQPTNPNKLMWCTYSSVSHGSLENIFIFTAKPSSNSAVPAPASEPRTRSKIEDQRNVIKQLIVSAICCFPATRIANADTMAGRVARRPDEWHRAPSSSRSCGEIQISFVCALFSVQACAAPAVQPFFVAFARWPGIGMSGGNKQHQQHAQQTERHEHEGSWVRKGRRRRGWLPASSKRTTLRVQRFVC